MTYDDTLADLRRRTTPSAHSVARVRGRLDAHLSSAAGELSALPAPSAAMIQRVRTRLAAARSHPTSSRPWGWLVATGLLGSVALAAWTSLDAETDPRPVERTLAGADTTQVAPGVRASFDGSGTVGGTDDQLVIRWEVGRLDLTVEAGRSVTVITSEGRSSAGPDPVVFGVDRSALGTTWSTDRGPVSTTCDAEQLGSTCLPTSATGLLGRGRAQQVAGVAPLEVLRTFSAGLDAAHEGAVRAELHAAKVRPLLTLGRHDEALVAVRAALEEGVEGVRTEPLHRTAARLHLLRGACAEAVPHLRALSAPTEEELGHLAACEAAR